MIKYQRILKINKFLYKRLFHKQVEYSDFEQCTQELANWAVSKGSQFCHRIGIMPRGLFCGQKVFSGANMISIPSKLCFIVDNLKPTKSKDTSIYPLCKLSKYLPWPEMTDRFKNAPFYEYPKMSGPFYFSSENSLRQRALVALCLMYEYSLYKDSDWFPWISVLPPPPTKNENIFIGGPTLPSKYLKELRGTQAFYDIINMKIDYDGIWIWLSDVIRGLPCEFRQSAFKRRFFDHFMMLAGQQSSIMPPIIDFTQKSKTSALTNVKKVIYQSETPIGPTEFVSLHAIRDIEVGEELLLDYNLSFSDTFVRYGFANPVSKRDKFILRLSKINLSPDDKMRVKGILGHSYPTCREIEWNDSLINSYDNNDMWKWYSFLCKYDSDALNSTGNNLKVEIDYIYPPIMLFGAIYSICEKKGITPDEDIVLKKSIDYIKKRYAELKFDLLYDENILLNDFNKIEEQIRKEFSFMIDENEEFDGVKRLTDKNKTIEYKLEKIQNKINRDGVASLHIPMENTVIDVILRDIVYMRYIEKTYWKWVLEHLKIGKLEVCEEIVKRPKLFNGSDDMCGYLESLKPSLKWLDISHIWAHPAIKKKFGLITEDEMKKMRELFRLNEEWRAKMCKDTFEETMYDYMPDAMKEEFVHNQRLEIPWNNKVSENKNIYNSNSRNKNIKSISGSLKRKKLRELMRKVK